MKCRARIMLKLAEKEVLRELKDHDHGPPTKVYDKGVWKIIGKDIIKGDYNAKSHAKNKTGQTLQCGNRPEKICQVAQVRTTGVSNKEVQTVDVQIPGVQTIAVQTTDDQTMEAQTVEVQTVEIQTTETEVLTTEAQTSPVEITESQPKFLLPNTNTGLFTDNSSTEVTKMQSSEIVDTVSLTGTVPRMDIPMTALIAESNNYQQSSQTPIYYQSPEGVQIKALAQPVEVNQRADTILKTTQMPYKGKCAKHSCVHKTSFQNSAHVIPKKVATVNSSENVKYIMVNAKSLPVSQPMTAAYAQSLATAHSNTPVRPMLVAQPTMSTAQSMSGARPNNVTQTSKFVNLYYVQTDKGPQIMAISQPLPCQKITQNSPSVKVIQSTSLIPAQIPAQTADTQSYFLIDLPSSSQPSSVVNTSHSSKIPNLSTVIQPTTSMVYAGDISSYFNQPQPSVSKVTPYSTSTETVISSKVVNSSPLLLTQLSSSMVSQYFTSLDEPSAKLKQKMISLDNQPTTSKVNQPPTAEINQPSTAEIIEPFPSDVIKPPSLEIDKPYVAGVNLPPFTTETSNIFTSEVIQPSISEIDQSFPTEEVQSALEVDKPNPEVNMSPIITKSVIKTTKGIIKVPKVAKRISKPRMSKSRAELLMKTYLSDFSDDE